MQRLSVSWSATIANTLPSFVVDIPSLQANAHLMFFCSNIITHISLGTALLMSALILHGNISAISGNERNIASLRRNAIAWLSRPRQMANARFWKKWLRLGKGWVRRRITNASSQPTVFRQPRLRALLPDEATLVPCVAANPALAHSRHAPAKPCY